MPLKDISPQLPKIIQAGGETNPPAEPTVIPPPVQPPEYYTGYQTERIGSSKDIYQAAKRAESASSRYTQLQQLSSGWNPAHYLYLAVELKSEAGYNQALSDAQAEATIAEAQLRSAEWRQHVLDTLPLLLQSSVQSIKTIDDVTSLIPNDSQTAEDKMWLTSTFEKLKYLSKSLPSGFDGTVAESQQKIIDTILAEPKVSVRAVHNLTVEELSKSFQPSIPELPQGLTLTDVRDILKQQQVEDTDEQKKLSDYLNERASAWATETDRLNLIRAGLLQPTSPDITPGEFVNLLIVQPFMGSMQLLNKYFDILPRPLAAGVVIIVKNLIKSPEDSVAGRIQEQYNYFREQGESTWSALALAENSADMPWYTRMLLDTAFDPTTYIGLGLATATAKGGGRLLTRIGLRTIGSRIGPLVEAAESGYVRAADAIFIAGKESLLVPAKGSFWVGSRVVSRIGAQFDKTWIPTGFEIPFSMTELSKQFARSTASNFNAVLGRMYPKGMVGLTAQDIREAAQVCIDAALQRPGEALDAEVKVGSQLLEYSYLTAEDAAKMLKEVVPEGFEFTTPHLARINDEVANMLSGVPVKDTAGKLITNAGVNATDKAVDSVSSKLLAFKDDIVDDAMRVFKKDNPKDQLIGFYDRAKQVRYDNLVNPITDHMTQAGQTISWVSRVTDRMMQSSLLVAMERRLVMPMARMNLLFANFGPMNWLENVQRSFLGGAEVMYPRSYGGIAETNRLFRGLTNAPYELVMAEHGEQRLEMAVIDPKTGSTSAFRNGGIPLVQREVTVKGKSIGLKFNIRGVDYKVTDLQSYNDVWESMTTLQRAYDYQVHYLKVLARDNPEEMGMIVENALANKSKLEEIGKFSKSDVTDIHRTMIQDSTVSPEAVEAHLKIDTLELERRQISQKLGVEFDKCPEVRTITKKNIRDGVLDGSIFADLPAAREASKNGERELSLISLAKQINALKKQSEQFARVYGGKATLLDELSQDIRLGVPSITAVTPEMQKSGFTRASIILNGEDIGSLTYRIAGSGKEGELAVEGLNITKTGVFNRRTLQDVDLVVNDLANKSNVGKVSIISKKEHNNFYLAGGYKKGAGTWYTKDVMQPQGVPQSIDELLSDLESINAMQNAIGNKIHEYRTLAELRSQKLKPGKEVDDFHVGSNKLLGQFMEQSQASMDSIVQNLKDLMAHRQGIKISDSQVKAVDALADVYRLQNQRVLATRNRLAEVESKISKTPPKLRNARFWQQQRAEKSLIWDEDTINARKLLNLQLDASRVFLNSVGKPAFVPDSIPAVVGALTPSHIAYLFGATGDDVYRGLTQVIHNVTVNPKEGFIDYVSNQAKAYAQKFSKSAADIGFTDQAIGDVYDQLWRNLGIEPSTLTPDTPTMMQIDNLYDELTRLHATVKFNDTDTAKWRQYVQGMADGLRNMPMYQKTGKLGWIAKKESALTNARKLHELAYPTYDTANVIDETMRSVFPFWNYETFRWRWIPRTFMRTPGTLTSLARFTDYTNGGYVPIPFTDLQLNPLRGSIWMGGMRRFFLKDFPEYYDSIPGMQFIDFISRAGFFPGIHVMAPIVLFGTGSKPQISELAPTWVQTSLSALRALSPEHIGKVLDIVYPDRFRDYQTMLTLAEQGYDADAIWRKKTGGQTLTPEEEKLWLHAENKANGVKGILMQQTGMLRIRPAEYEQIHTEMQKAIADTLGVPVRVQQQIDRMYPVTGKRLADYYNLDVLQGKLLYDSESYRKWQGVSASLMPASWQAMDARIKDYWDILGKNSTDARRNGVYENGILVQPSIVDINRQWVEGEIGPDQWKSQRDAIQSRLSAGVDALANSSAYKDVPKTLDERVAWLTSRGIATPTYSPDQELLWYYYQLKPEVAYNPESGRNELDYDTYYAKVDALLGSMDTTYRQRLLDRIQLDWTPLEKLYWQVSREYLRSYRAIRDIVLNEYTDEQKQLIRRYEVARGAERETLQSAVGPDGSPLIAGFSAKVTEARKKLRLADPDLDAWSYFFGNTDSLLTSTAKVKYDEFTKKYLTEDMVQ